MPWQPIKEWRICWEGKGGEGGGMGNREKFTSEGLRKQEGLDWVLDILI